MLPGLHKCTKFRSLPDFHAATSQPLHLCPTTADSTPMSASPRISGIGVKGSQGFEQMIQRPHVSAAIVSLRGWVTVACILLCLCAITQLLVFSFARFTEVRFTTLTAVDAAPEIVESRGTRPIHNGKADDVNRVPSITDRNMASVSSFVSSVGSATAIGLVLLTMLGVAVGGGAAVPGIDKVVKACAWSMICACIAVPWSNTGWGDGSKGGSLLPGVFCSYETLTAAADTTGGLRTLACFVVMPLAVFLMGIMVGGWFHSGVERGVIVTAISQLDEAVEREVAAIRARGVGSLSGNSARVLGAMNTAIGETPAEPGRLRKAAGAESLSDSSLNLPRSIQRGRDGSPKRPI